MGARGRIGAAACARRSSPAGNDGPRAAHQLRLLEGLSMPTPVCGDPSYTVDGGPPFVSGHQSVSSLTSSASCISA
jgi:hypothetical protein